MNIISDIKNQYNVCCLQSRKRKKDKVLLHVKKKSRIVKVAFIRGALSLIGV